MPDSALQSYYIDYLVHLVAKIESGQIRVPAFQRAYRWKHKQVLELMHSLQNGYPIGTIMLAESNEAKFALADPGVTGIPVTPVSYPVNYVVDGVQRLSTIYNCFKWKDRHIPDKFNIIYDVGKDAFAHYDPSHLPDTYIHLPNIFSTSTISTLYQHLGGNVPSEYLTRVVHVQRQLSSYQVPVLFVATDDWDSIIEMYLASNMNAKPLTKSELERARKKVRRPA